jgi:hypothetical protein
MMRPWEDDACSDSSWLIAPCDVQSDSSWLLEDSAGLQSQHRDSDLHSNMSWDIISDKDQCMTPRHSCQIFPKKAQIEEWLASDSGTASLIDLIRAGRAEVALCRVRNSPELAQVTQYGDSALSWAVYKAKWENVAWLELVCELLIHAPADVKERNSYQLLPLHDAAWGNAPTAIGVVLCAAFPGAAKMFAHGQTPLQLGHYHHTTSRRAFSWPAREEMLSTASALAQEADFLKKIAALGLSGFSQEALRSASVVELQCNLGIQQPIAELIHSFLMPPQVQPPKWASTMSSIPERKPTMCSIPEGRPRRCGRAPATALESAANTNENTLPELACDELFAREECAKNTSHYAGVRRLRNTRCSFRELTVVRNSQGCRFFFSTHSVRAMPEGSRAERKERKWPSKTNQTQERKKERALKEAFMWA